MERVVIKTAEQIEVMRRGGAILARIVRELAEQVAVGMPTYEFDLSAKALCQKYGVTSGTLGYQGYPAAVCISLNDELVHGIPAKDRIVAAGDVLKIDMVIIYQDYYLDHAVTLGVGKLSEVNERLIKVTELATLEAIKVCRVGKTIGDVSHTMQTLTELAGFNVTRQMTGHGIGRNMHEAPEIFCFGEKGQGPEIVPGMTLAIENMAMRGGPWLDIDKNDQWTARTTDGSFTAHFEHTVAVTPSGTLILTKE